MRTRGAEGSPLRTPQLWEFWERGGKSPAAPAARSPAAAPLPAAPPCASPASAAGGKAAALPPAEEAAAAASPVGSAGASDGSPAHSPRKHRRLWTSLKAKSVEELQACHLELTHFETTLTGVALLQTVFNLKVQAGQTTPAQTSPAPAQSAGVPQELAPPRCEPVRQQRAGNWRLAARVPRHLGALTSTHLPLMGVVNAAASHTAVTGSDTTGAAADGAEAAALPPPGPPTLVWDVLCDEAVCRVKECLNTAATVSTGAILCRDEERNQVLNYCREKLQAGHPGSLYVSGVPGTGKSLTLRALEAAAGGWGNPPPLVAYVNCMGLKDSNEIFFRLIDALGGERPNASRQKAPACEVQAVDSLPEVAALRRLITERAADNRKRKSDMRDGGPNNENAGGVWALILLDEMDALFSRTQGILYQLFALPTLPGARCVLVGAANTMNLTDRVLPGLRARACEPVHAAFPAYNVAQLAELLRARLATLPWRVFEDAALDLCARRVAAASGDMRRALHAACAAVDIARDEANKANDGIDAEDDGVAPPKSNGLVRTTHMALALSQSFKLPIVDTIRGLPRHHLLTLCTAVLLFRGGERNFAMLGELNDAYTALCDRKSLKGLSAADFSSVCNALADNALIVCTERRGEERMRRITLRVREEDVVFALQGNHLCAALLAE